MQVRRSYFDIRIQIIAFHVLSMYSSTWKSLSLEILCVVTPAVCEGYGNFYSVCTIVFPFVSCQYECHSRDNKTYLNPYVCALCLLKTFIDILSVLSSTTFHRICVRKNNSKEYFFSLSVVGKRKPERKELYF